MTRKRVAILGSTGSIGRSALAVAEAYPDRVEVVGLAAGVNAPLFVSQVQRFHPRAIAMASRAALAEARNGMPAGARFDVTAHGAEGLVAVATHPDVDIVLFASSGTAGLDAVLAAIEAGKTVALANKEVLVMAGFVVTEAARRRDVRILPVDSEHNAIHQCLHGRDPRDVERLILTASGGPFRTLSDQELERVTPEDALRHPTWRMGPKITVDSATLMNKGLEVIEAHWLFDVPAGRIDVVVHPQSIVHSMVELKDGSVLAQLGVTDMRLPIQYAFSYPERWDGTLERLDLTRAGRLDFLPPDPHRFPCLALAFRALRDGGALPIVLNAANEVAARAFLAHRLPFTGIPRLIERAIEDAERRPAVDVKSLTDVREADAWARARAEELLAEAQTGGRPEAC
ncbi:MAG TPA: 1-deoxy-D-xylulose-5-phosphate reductoisomerase [Vicinamibacterales bacterium]|nr:1-deoxy-D-xylulose-5-phosphate reductoisomerase [Vicinamibacterales bacterium]